MKVLDTIVDDDKSVVSAWSNSVVSGSIIGGTSVTSVDPSLVRFHRKHCRDPCGDDGEEA